MFCSMLSGMSKSQLMRTALSSQTKKPMPNCWICSCQQSGLRGAAKKRCGITKPQFEGFLQRLIPMLHTCRRMICEDIFLITSNKHSAAKAT